MSLTDSLHEWQRITSEGRTVYWHYGISPTRRIAISRHPKPWTAVFYERDDARSVRWTKVGKQLHAETVQGAKRLARPHIGSPSDPPATASDWQLGSRA